MNPPINNIVAHAMQRSQTKPALDRVQSTSTMATMHPQIRQHIVMAKQQTLLDILQSPTATPEFATNIDTPPHVLVLTQQMQVMQDQMAKLTAEVNVTTTTQGQEKQVNFQPRARSQEKTHPQDRWQLSKSTERQSGQQSRCSNCGYSYYGDQNHSCHAYCHNCSKRGYFAPVCRSKNQNYFRPKIPKL